MPYLGKQPAASALVVESGSIQSAEIEDGTIEDSDISSNFKGLLSGSAVVNASSVTAASISGSITSTGSFGSLIIADKVQGNLDLGGNITAVGISGSITSTGSFGKVEVGGGKIITTGNMVLDADGAQIRLEDGGTEFGRLSRVSSDLVIKSITNDKDMLFKGVDNSSTITALSLDMSEGGNAEFSGNVSGSLVSTASFGSVNATHLNGVFEGTLGSVANALISGSTVVNAPNISGSITSTGSFGSLVVADKVQGNLDLGGNITAAGDISTSGSIFAREFHMEFTSASVIFASGSNKFGDDSGDTHRFTGSMLVSGSITMADGDLTVTDNLDIEGDVDINGTTNLDNTDIDGTLTVDGGNIVFNEDSADQDFRVESNGDANMLFVDGGNNRVGIGTGSPAKALHIVGATDDGLFEGLQIDNTDHASGETGQSVAINMRLAQASTMRDAGRITIGKDDDWDDAAATDSHMTFKTMLNNTLTEQMRLKGGGDVGVGTTNPDGRFHIHNSSAGSVTANGDANELVVENGGSGGISILTPAANQGEIAFGDPDDNNVGRFAYNHPGNYFAIVAAASEIMRISGSGLVGIGTNAPAAELDLHHASEPRLRVRRGSIFTELAQNSSGAVMTMDMASGNAGIQLNSYGNSFISGSIALGGTHTPSSDFGFNTFVTHLKRDGDIAFVIDNATEKFEFCMNNDSDDLRIGAGSNNDILHLSASGAVGIGTNNPGSIRLVVRDNSTDTGTGDPVTVGTNASSSLFRVQPRFNSVLDIGQGADPYPIWIQAADISNLAQFYELSLNPVGGHVGIGTLNPQDELHVDNGTLNSGCFIRVQNDGTTGYVGAGLILNAKNATQRGAGVFMHNQHADKGFYAGVIYNVAFERYSICYEARALQDESTADPGHEIVQIQTDGDYLSTTGTDIQQISDRRLKENIQDFTGGLDVLKNLQPRTFEWKEGRGNNRFGRTGTQYGFIAQEIESGSGVVDNMNLYKKVDITDGELDSDILDGTKYQSQLNAKDALYISAIKELSEKIESQQKQIEELKEGQNG